MSNENVSVFNFSPEELEGFKQVYLPIKSFDEMWLRCIQVTRQDNVGNPHIDLVIEQVYNQASYAVARDVFQIMLWREELLLNATKENDHGEEKETCYKEEKDYHHI